jgi:hypothetical protein
MNAKHRMPAPPESRSSLITPRVRRGMSRVAEVCNVLSVSALGAAGVLAVVLTGVQHDDRADKPVQVAQPVNQEGTLIAVSPNSVTARSPDGYTQTYVVTPNTSVVTSRGSQSSSTDRRFTVNEQVDIVGTVQGGTALATTVSDRGASHGGGSPMDFGDGNA